MAFSVHKVSEDKDLDCQPKRSSGVDKYSVRDSSGLNLMFASMRCPHHSCHIFSRYCWSKKPPYARKAADKRASLTMVLISTSKVRLPASQRALSEERLSS